MTFNVLWRIPVLRDKAALRWVQGHTLVGWSQNASTFHRPLSSGRRVETHCGRSGVHPDFATIGILGSSRGRVCSFCGSSSPEWAAEVLAKLDQGVEYRTTSDYLEWQKACYNLTDEVIPR